MTRQKSLGRRFRACVLAAVPLFLAGFPLGAQPVSLAPKSMSKVGTVDERFQSYNVEMVEVTGGRFWKPYSAEAKAGVPAPAPTPQSAVPGRGTAAAPALPPDLYQYRSPLDLYNARLRKLAAALGPAWVRVSGTWANTVYFQDSDDPAPDKPPTGFNAVLTRKQWKGVLDFVRAVDGKLMTSFAFGTGTRDANGVWTPEQARHVMAYTKAAGGSIGAAEFMNEPNYAANGGAPRAYDAATFGRDIEVFSRFFREASPGSLFLGPGSTGEGGVLGKMATPGKLQTEDLLKATGPVYDAFSYHIYAAVSQRCGGARSPAGTTSAAARTQEWLSQPDKINAFYADLRDRYMPGKQLWLTEVGDAACGGNPWASTFLDTFRYLSQHGRLARQGVQVIAHNTLSASDYGLLDEKTLDPRPNYWSALMWHRLMGRVVLDPGTQPVADLYIYAHCQANRPGGVTVLAINAGDTGRELSASLSGERYTLSATQPDSATVQLNGNTLSAASDGSLPPISGVPVRAGSVPLPPASITFLAFPQAANAACR